MQKEGRKEIEWLKVKKIKTDEVKYLKNLRQIF